MIFTSATAISVAREACRDNKLTGKSTAEEGTEDGRETKDGAKGPAIIFGSDNIWYTGSSQYYPKSLGRSSRRVTSPMMDKTLTKTIIGMKE
jgi:hypothetical protein